MRTVFLLIISWILLLGLTAQAEETGTASGAATDTPSGPEGLIRESEADSVQALLDHPELASFKEACKAEVDQADCMWTRIQQENPQLAQQLVQTLEQIHQQRKAAQAGTPAGRGPSSDGTTGPGYVGQDLNNLDQNKDPALRKVEEYFHNKLKEALYGDLSSNNNRQLKVVDHRVFSEMFESRVSKNIIEVISGFCLDLSNSTAVMNSGNSPVTFEIPSDGTAQLTARNNNLDLLKTNPQNVSTGLWNKCALGFKDACTYVAPSNSTSCPNREIVVAPPTSGSATASAAPPTPSGTPEVVPFCSKDAYTQGRACEVQRAVEGARKQLAYLAAVREGWDQLGNNGSGALDRGLVNCDGTDDEGKCKNAQAISVVTYNGTVNAPGQKSIDEVTTVTSADFDTAYKDDAAARKKLFDDNCTGGNFDQTICSQFMGTKAQGDEAKAHLAELGIRTRALQHKIHEKLADTSDAGKAELRNFLKEEGISESSIGQLVEGDAATRAKVAADIIKNYESQRKALIASMNERITSRTQQADGDLNQQNSSTIVANIQQELANKPGRYKQIIHFNNIVSGYLRVGTGGQNSASIQRELASMAEGVSGDSNYQTQLQQSVQQNAPQGSSSSDGSVFLRSDDVTNCMLNHTGSGSCSGNSP